MSKARVPLWQQPRSFATIDTRATEGAVIGANVWNADGSLFVPATAATPEPGNDVAVTLWRYVLEIPPNVKALAGATGTGLYAITGSGTSATRAITSTTLAVANGDGAGGNPALNLPALPDTGGGTLQKTARDQYGRLAGTSGATTDDLAEGSNLYFTDARADARVDAGIAEHVAQPDPHPQYLKTGDEAVQSVNGQTGTVELAAADVGAATAAQGATADSAVQPGDLAAVATSGAYGDLSGRPTLGTAAAANVGDFDPAGSAASIVTQSIIDGDTAHAPSGDAVFDALAGKFDKTGGTVTGAVTVSGSNLGINEPSGNSRSIRFSRADSPLWDFVLSGEGTGGNTGSELRYQRFSDTGGFLATVLRLMRNSGDIVFGQDNLQNLGAAFARAKEFFCANATINTSDAREKTAPRDLTSDEIAAAADLARLPSIFQWLHAIDEKGEAARLHCSPTVQSVIAAMESHGLDPFRYGFVCYDEWDETPEQRDPETDEVVQEYRAAGDRYSLRPSELAHFIMRGLVARQDAIETRLAALEA